MYDEDVVVVDLDGNEMPSEVADTCCAHELGNPAPHATRASQSSQVCGLAEIKADVVKKAPHYPYCDDEVHATSWRGELKPAFSFQDVYMEANLGTMQIRHPSCKKSSVQCQLAWLEPILWTLLQLRWTGKPLDNCPAVQRRATTCAWIELACIVSILTRGAGGPRACAGCDCAESMAVAAPLHSFQR